MTFKTARQLKLEKDGLDDRCRQRRLPDELIDRNRRDAQQAEERVSGRSVRFRRPGRGVEAVSVLAHEAGADRPKRFEHVIFILDQGGPFADKLIATLGARIEW